MTKLLSANDRTARAEAIVIEMIEAAARSGARCPTADELNYRVYQELGIMAAGGKIPALLARQGRWRIEIYGLNWRVIDIPGIGRTAPPPNPNQRPYRIIDKDGYRPVYRPRR